MKSWPPLLRRRVVVPITGGVYVEHEGPAMSGKTGWRHVFDPTRGVMAEISPHFSRRFARLVMAALICAVIAVMPRPLPSDPLEQIRFSRGIMEPRLTAFAYGSRHVSRSAEPEGASAQIALINLQTRVERERTPANLHRLALAKLAMGKTAGAYRDLVEASTAQPANADLLSDLAAAEMALGKIADSAEHSARVLDADPLQQSAAFNWGLSLEKLSNRPAAIDAWERYLTLDPGSDWAAEARQHLARLRAPRSNWMQDRVLLSAGADLPTIKRLVEKYPQHARTRIQNILLPAWAESGNEAELALMNAMAAVREKQDPFLTDVVKHAGDRRHDLREGFRAFKAACQAEDLGNLTLTAARFGDAADIFERAGSPLRYVAEIYSASAAFFSGRADGALERMEVIEQDLHASGRYPSIEAEAAWVRGIILMRGGRPHDALDAYDVALRAARRSGEIENEVALGDLVATELEIVGDPSDSEQYRLAALRRSDEISADPERMYVAYAETAFYALRAGRPRLALAFIASQTRVAAQMKDPQRLAWSEGQHALGLLQIGSMAEAEAAVGLARQQAQLIQDNGRRDWAIADIEYTAGRIAMLRSRPQQAVTAFSSSLGIWDRYDWRLHTAEAHAARAEAYLAVRDRRAAEDDFRAGIGEMEKQRADLEPAVRVAYFERGERLFTGLIDLLVEEERAEEALSIVERKRARLLLDQIAAEPSGAVPLETAAIVAAMRGPRAMLTIALGDGGTDLWLVTGGRAVHRRVAAPAQAIEAAVTRHLTAIATNDVEVMRREGRWLYDRLVAPVADSLPPGAALVVIPDGILQSFPFATLVAPDGSYLIEQRPLAMAPSASVFLQSPAGGTGQSLLAVAQPAPVGMEALPNVEAEVGAIARTNPRSQIRIGEEVTPAEFLMLAGGASLVHFAGHARTDAARPARSALLFESAADAPAELTARAIGASRLRAHPFVVLAACSTGRGTPRRNEGSDSLAAAFLRAGARGVLATLWDVDDAVSPRLFDVFHENLRRGASPAEALRQTQRFLIHSQNPADRDVSLWGSAAVYGTL